MFAAGQAVYTPGGLLGEVLTSLVCLTNLGLRAAPGESQGKDGHLSVNDMQNFITCLLIDYPFPYNSVCLPMKSNPEVVAQQDSQDQLDLTVESIKEEEWMKNACESTNCAGYGLQIMMQNMRPHAKIINNMINALYNIEKTPLAHIMNSPTDNSNSLIDVQESIEQQLGQDAKSRTNSLYHKSSNDDEKTQYKKMSELKEKIRISFGPPEGHQLDNQVSKEDEEKKE